MTTWSEAAAGKNGRREIRSTTNLINALAEKHGVELHQTPVGFNHIGVWILEDEIAIGREESAGLSIGHHLPRKRRNSCGTALLGGRGSSREVAR